MIALHDRQAVYVPGTVRRIKMGSCRAESGATASEKRPNDALSGEPHHNRAVDHSVLVVLQQDSCQTCTVT